MSIQIPPGAGAPPAEEQPVASGPETPASAGSPPSLEADYSQNQARYEQLAQAKTKADLIIGELDGLVAKGDAVTSEQVVQAAGMLVANGIEVKLLATLLADMPTTDGQLLSEWLKGHQAQMVQLEAQLTPAFEVAKHDMGVSALRMIAHGAMQGYGLPAGPLTTPATPAGGPAPANSLAMMPPAGTA